MLWQWYSVKSREKGDHLADLRRVFDIIQAHKLKMNPTKSFLGVASGKFLESLLHPKEFIWIWKTSVSSKRCNLWRILKNSELTGMIGIYLEIYIESFRTLPTLHQINEEGSLIHLGQRLPRSIQRVQGVSQTPTCSGSSSIRKIFPIICSSNGSFLGSFTRSEQWSKLWIGDLLFK